MFRNRIAGVVVGALVANLFVLGASEPAAADTTELFVNNGVGANCSDTGTGLPTQPFCTIGAAVAVVTAGQTIRISGTYAEQVTITKSGAPGQPITLLGDSTAKLSGAGVGLTIDGQHDISVTTLKIKPSPGTVPVKLVGSTRLTLTSVQVNDVLPGAPLGTAGVSLAGVTDSTLKSVWVNALAVPGIMLDADSARVLVANTRIQAFGPNGFVTAVEVHGTDITVANGFLNNVGKGVLLAADAKRAIVVNNTVANARDIGIDNVGATGSAITNNTVSQACGSGIRVSGAASGVSVQNNIAWRNGTHWDTSCLAPVADQANIEVTGAAVGGTVADFNSVQAYQDTPTKLYRWNGVNYATVAAFREASGQGTHDQLSGLFDTVNHDSANSAAPGWPALDKDGRFREDDPGAPNTGSGPSVIADRGAAEAVQGAKASLVTTYSDGGTTVTFDASATQPGWVPLVATPYRFIFGDGTEVTQASPIVTHHYAQRTGQSAYVSVSDTNGITTSASRGIGGGTYLPVGPVRVLDTRNAIGIATRVPVAAGASVSLQVAGLNGVPATGLAGVAVNVTVTSTAGSGYLTVFPSGTQQPIVSNLNWSAGSTTANMAEVPVGEDGRITLANGSTGTVHVLVDLLGYYTSAAGGLFTPRGPVRVLDTRYATGVATTTPVPAGATISVPVTGANGVPASGVTAVALNVTITGATASGYLTAYADGAPRPTASNLNWAAGRTVPNMVVVPVVNGRVAFFNGGTSTVHVLADLLGYYSPDAGAPVQITLPYRVLDTRTWTSSPNPLAPHEARELVLFEPTTTATAVLLNVTVTGPTSSGYLTAYPAGTTMPNASSLNWVAGQTVANLVLVPIVNGKVAFYNGSSGTTHLLVDFVGYINI
ncbi:hypothetical protein F4553_004479 [Allocatelliglobosispora scoriae]|uniref:Right handed beta helix domain-containing protein n=1 Tax=Allocatelliglobosispora scoriae TaxID=643052 RepID=A0A841BWI2_9ACTN|nr:right-handed parallel beta-helix repeat-containing protein [Allocatelliglobosispora scoriae]MBB5871100.1 hypothetical protein [Allocatelliglobosispora scoriae]